MPADRFHDVVGNIQAQIRELEIYSYPDRVSLLRLIGNPPNNHLSLQGKQEFPGTHGPHIVDYALHFEKHKHPQMSKYYPTSLVVKVNEPNRASRSFNLKGDEYFTLRQAVNLLAGRAVYKLYYGENRIMPAWHKLNNTAVDLDGNAFIQRFEHVADRIEKTLDSLPIDNLSTIREDVLDSLFNGDLVKVSLRDNKSTTPAYIQVNPERKTIQTIPISKDGNISNVSRKSIRGRNSGL